MEGEGGVASEGVAVRSIRVRVGLRVGVRVRR